MSLPLGSTSMASGIEAALRATDLDADLEKLIPKLQTQSSFPDFSLDSRERCSELLPGLLEQSRVTLLGLLRILSRDPVGLDLLFAPKVLTRVIAIAGLDNGPKTDEQCELEAVKILCNLGFQSESIRRTIAGAPFNKLNKRLTEANSLSLTRFLTRLFFVVTIKEPGLRETARKDLAALTTLSALLAAHTKASVPVEEAELLEEVLKSLYNIGMTLHGANVIEDTDEDACERLVLLARVLLEIQVPERQTLGTSLRLHTVNLLTVMPGRSYQQLSAVLPSDVPPKTFMARDTRAWASLLKILKERLDLVLPPLGSEVMRRPEEGSTVRNRLAKLMTAPDGQSPHLSATFLFQLCKKSVDRLIKYTGFGNAAGLLASNGLLGGRTVVEGANENSTDDDSDTEEYIQAKPKVNPVTGCFEEDGPNPMEGMSDEQKEYEAMRLVDEINKLMSQGVIRPATIGEDGKPKPVDHILELTKDIHPPEEKEED